MNDIKCIAEKLTQTQHDDWSSIYLRYSIEFEVEGFRKANQNPKLKSFGFFIVIMRKLTINRANLLKKWQKQVFVRGDQNRQSFL